MAGFSMLGTDVGATLRQVGRKWIGVLAVAVVLSAALSTTGAEAAEPYLITGVPVDVTATDAATARDQAIVEGQRLGLKMLLEQLVGIDRAATIVLPGDEVIGDMVQDFEVEQERLSSVRYIGVLTYRFAAAPVDRLLGKSTETGTDGMSAGGVPFGPTQTLTVAVPLRSLRDWIEIQRRVAAVPSVRQAIVRSIAHDQGGLDIVFAGDRVLLAQALARNQLTLTEVDAVWFLTMPGGAAIPLPSQQTGTP